MAKSKQTYVKPGRVTPSRDMQEKVHEDTKTRAAAEADALKDELDDLLDEVDAVLEENAEEFVKSYIQKGGE
jgi:ubiquitin-like protein Pup